MAGEWNRISYNWCQDCAIRKGLARKILPRKVEEPVFAWDIWFYWNCHLGQDVHWFEERRSSFNLLELALCCWKLGKEEWNLSFLGLYHVPSQTCSNSSCPAAADWGIFDFTFFCQKWGWIINLLIFYLSRAKTPGLCVAHSVWHIHRYLQMLKINIYFCIYLCLQCGKAVFAKTGALSAMPAPYHVFVGVSRLLSPCLGVVSR